MVIAAGVMIANIFTIALIMGFREGFKHIDDATVPKWAWWCLVFPFIALAAFVYVADS
jgi:hypothetical protein